MRTRASGGAKVIIIILVVIILVLALAFWLFWQQNNTKDESEKTTATEKVQTGTVTGSLSYPSEGIPDEMMACAVERDTVEEYCTSEKLSDSSYTYGTGYELEVPAGIYYVYAYLNYPETEEQNPNALGSDYKAYYSDFVTCGQTTECVSHDPIEVTVTAGKTVSEIDPVDWYAGD